MKEVPICLSLDMRVSALAVEDLSQLRQVAKDENHRRSKRLLTDFSKCLTCFRHPQHLGSGYPGWCWMLVSKFANSSVENAVRSVASINRGRLASRKRSCLETIAWNYCESKRN